MHQTVPGVLVSDIEAAEGRAGAFYFDADNWLGWCCPCGCGQIVQIPVTTKPVPGVRGWTWNGNREQPTITPSIRRMDRCKWHGYLTNGMWTPCGDSGQ